MKDVGLVRGAWRAGGYVAEELIGHGGSADVWRGRQARTGEAVALKRIPMRGDQAVHSARAEAAVLAALTHPHLIAFRELVPADGAIVLVLELAAGGSLATLLDRRRFLAPGEVVTALAPICAALAYAHTEGLVHSDVSTGNVLFTADGRPLLADLGVSRLLGGAAAADGATDVVGTAAYLDPVVAGGAAPGQASDVFAVAAVALHALTGRPAWPAESVAAAVTLAARGEIPDLGERLSRAPAPLRRVLERALCAEPFRRGTAAELALDLRHSVTPVPVELRGGRTRTGLERPALHVPRHSASAPLGRDDERGGLLTHAVRRPDPAPTPAGRLRRRPSRRVAAAAAAALVAVLVVAGLAVRADRSAGHVARPAPSTRVSAPTRASSAPRVTESTTAPRTQPADDSDFGAVLADLDARRAHAYATRDAQVLSEVYAPGTLLAQDTATLYRTVPAGCGLMDLRTQFAASRAVVRAEHTVQVTTQATLTESRLMCHGVETGRSAAVGPVRMTLLLVRTGGSYRIGQLTVTTLR